jgi:hypothetical protein
VINTDLLVETPEQLEGAIVGMRMKGLSDTHDLAQPVRYNPTSCKGMIVMRPDIQATVITSRTCPIGAPDVMTSIAGASDCSVLE